MSIYDYLIFKIIFLGLANWITFYYLILNLSKPKQKLIDIKDKKLTNIAKEKAGLNNYKNHGYR